VRGPLDERERAYSNEKTVVTGLAAVASEGKKLDNEIVADFHSAADSPVPTRRRDHEERGATVRSQKLRCVGDKRARVPEFVQIVSFWVVPSSVVALMVTWN
jgi:hypothetical protein